jgi:LemA protein
MTGLLVAGGGAALFGIVVMLAWNRLVTFRQAVHTSWAGLDVELQRRHDLIGNLAATVAGGAEHERRVQVEVASARAASAVGDAAERSRRETELARTASQLLALREAYPRLQAGQGFAALQHELVVTEDRIAAARRLFNNNVASYNRRVQTVPLALLAALGGFRPATYLDLGMEIDPVQVAAILDPATSSRNQSTTA